MVALMVAGSLMFANGSGDKAAAGDKKVVIGALIRNLDEDFVRIYADNLKALAAKNNVDLKLVDARNDQANQLDQLNTLLSQGVKFFVIVPVQTEMTEQMTQAINKKGGGAAFSNIQPSVAALKVGKNFFHASSPESVAGAMQADIIDTYFKKFPAKLAPNKTINAIMLLGQLGHPRTGSAHRRGPQRTQGERLHCQRNRERHSQLETGRSTAENGRMDRGLQRSVQHRYREQRRYGSRSG